MNKIEYDYIVSRMINGIYYDEVNGKYYTQEDGCILCREEINYPDNNNPLIESGLTLETRYYAEGEIYDRIVHNMCNSVYPAQYGDVSEYKIDGEWVKAYIVSSYTDMDVTPIVKDYIDANISKVIQAYRSGYDAPYIYDGLHMIYIDTVTGEVYTADTVKTLNHMRIVIIDMNDSAYTII